MNEDDSEWSLINQTDNVEDLRKGKSFWQDELGNFPLNGLNGREVTLF